MCDIGFTGTRRGMNSTQKEEFKNLLIRCDPLRTRLHHGDCLGADKDAHDIATELGVYTITHPPTKIEFRAFCKAKHSFPPKDYLTRNRDIAETCDFLVACPMTQKETLRGGTWYTVRHARKIGKQVRILWPKGEKRRFSKSEREGEGKIPWGDLPQTVDKEKSATPWKKKRVDPPWKGGE